mgnify:CR=1 FL=1
MQRYVTSIRNLFDPVSSSLEVQAVDVTDSSGQFVVTAEVEGVLQLSRALPWRPRVAPYQVEATYSLIMVTCSVVCFLLVESGISESTLW